MSTNLEYRARERQRKSGRPAKLNEKKGDRDLEREIKKEREENKERHNMKSRGDNASGKHCREKMSGSEKKKVNENTYDIFSMKNFLEVSRYSSAKQRQRNLRKKCAARAKLLFC